MSVNGDAEAFREAIICVSLELGQAYGEDGVTMRAIASRLGTSATALYSCFESKAAIMRHLRVRGVVSLTQALLDGVGNGDAQTELLGVSRRYIAFARDNPWLYRTVFIEDSLFHRDGSPSEITALTTAEHDFEARFIVWVTEANGRPPANPSRAVGQWWAAMHGIASLILTGHIVSDHRYLPVGELEEFIDTYIRGAVTGLATVR